MEDPESSCASLCGLKPECVAPCVAAAAPVSAGALAGSILLTLFLLCGSAFFSGLTLGLLSLDVPGLELIEACGEPDDRRHAKQIIPLRQKGNQLLCTLLLGNTFVNSFIAISTASITAGLVGTALSTGFILVFGEIIPQAVCSRYALYIGARSIPIVRVFVLLFWPLSWPISKLLDYALGRELRTIYNRKELDKLLSIAVQDPQGDLRPEEMHLMSSALAFSEKRASMIMTRLDHTFCIEVGSKLSFEALLRCYKSGYTRIPVYRKDPSCVVGLLFAKDLILVDPDDEIPVGAMLSFCGRPLHVVSHDTTIDKVLAAAQTQRSHLFFVVDGPDAPAAVAKWPPPIGNVIGIVTLEDVLEELIAAEIVDETDTIRDNHSRLGVDMNAALRIKRMEFFYAIQVRRPRRAGVGRRPAEAATLHAAPHALARARARPPCRPPSQAKRHPRRHISEEELRAITTFLIANAEPFARANLTHKVRRRAAPCSPRQASGLPARRSSALPTLRLTRSPRLPHPAILQPARPPARAAARPQCIRKLLNRCPVLTVEASGAHLGLVARVEPIFAKRQRTDRCCLVLSGQLRITCSDDNLETEAGPWSILALNALTDVDYMPDYAAEVITTARLLFISRQQYEEVVRSRPDRPTGADWLADGPNGAGARARAFDWDASARRNFGPSGVLESGASAMLPRPYRTRMRSHDDSEALREPASSSGSGALALVRSHSHPELSADGEPHGHEDQRPLCDLIADLSEPNYSASSPRNRPRCDALFGHAPPLGALPSSIGAADVRAVHAAVAAGNGPQRPAEALDIPRGGSRIPS